MRSARVVVPLLAVVAVAAGGPGVGATTLSAEPSPSASDGPGVPPDARFDYEAAIREHVTVTTGRDDDGDGQPDRVTLDIVRPDTDEPVPVLMEQSPYWEGVGRGREHETKGRQGGTVVSMPLFYDNWFVPRGYAFVALEVPGTGTAGGCEDNFGPAAVAAATAALDWLAGTGPAEDATGTEVAAAWSDGRVAMIGKSYDGGMAISTAATGHPALRAIVPVAGVSAALERATSGGLLSGGVQEAEWYDGDPCETWAVDFLDRWGDGFTYTDFWRERDPTVDMSRWTAATFVVNGFRDLNVGTSQAELLWHALAATGVPRAMWLHQGAHDDPFDVRRAEWVGALTEFLDHSVRGDDNGFEARPPVSVQDSDGTWRELPDWPPPADAQVWGWRDGHLAVADPSAPEVPLAAIGAVSRDAAGRAAPDFEGYVDFWLGDLGADRPYRVVLASAPLTEPMTITGEPTLTASFRQTGARYGVVATLVDLGPGMRADLEAGVLGEGLASLATESCYGASDATDDACYFDAEPALSSTEYGFIASGGTGIERATFRDRAQSVPDGEWVAATIDLGLANATIPAGHQLAVIFTASSIVALEQPTTRTVEIGSDLRLDLPVAPG